MNEIPELPEMPHLPEMYNVTDERGVFIEPPEPPVLPDLHTLLGDVAKIYYIQGNLNRLSQNEAAFLKASADAVLVWEK